MPFIASWPAATPAGSENSDLIDFSDILPTICAAAAIDVPADPLLTGRSFLPQLKGEQGEPREWLYCWYHPRGHNDVTIFARTLQYKLHKSGEFYDVSKDLLEENPLNVSELSEVAMAAHAKLVEALAGFEELEKRHDAVYPKKAKSSVKDGS